MKKGLLKHVVLFVLLLAWTGPLWASHQPEFSVAGFFELPNTGRTVYSMNPAWRFHKGSISGADQPNFGSSDISSDGIKKKKTAEQFVYLNNHKQMYKDEQQFSISCFWAL